MKSLRSLFAAVLMAASLIGGQAHASLIGESINGNAEIVIGTTPVPADWAIDQFSATVGAGAEFTVFGGAFVSFDFAASTLTINFEPDLDNWLNWPSYTFSGFASEIVSFQLIEAAGILAGSDLLDTGSHGYTASSVTVFFGDGELDSSSNGPAYMLFSIGTRQHVPEPQSILLVLAALGLMGVNLRRGSALPR